MKLICPCSLKFPLIHILFSWPLDFTNYKIFNRAHTFESLDSQLREVVKKKNGYFTVRLTVRGGGGHHPRPDRSICENSKT